MVEQRSHRRERGATALIFAFSLVVLIGFMAFAIDPGVLFQEKRDLQTGAEAAALAVAQDCAPTGTCPSQGAMQTRARDYLSANLTDGPGRIVGNVVVDESASTVTVTVGGYDTANNRDGDPNTTDLFFGPVIGVDGFDIQARAVASFGGVGAAAATPLIFSVCEYQMFGASGSQVVLKFHNSGSATICNGPAGQDAPGGFGWLVPDGVCLAHTDAGGWFSSSPGVSPPGNGQKRCKTAEQIGLTVNGQPNPLLLIPIFDQVQGNGSNAQFHLYGYAGFAVQGWFFTSQIKGDPADVYKLHCHSKGPGPHPGNNYDDCVIGNFVRFYAPGEVAGGPDLGVTTVSLVG